MGKLKQLGKVLVGLYLAASLLVAVPVWLELSIRLFRPLYFTSIKRAPEEYYELPGTFDIAQHNALSHVYRPRQMYHGRAFHREKPAGTLRIITLGGSTAYGHAVGDSNFSQFLEQKLKSGGMNVEVLNAGVMGYSTVQSLTYFATTGIDLKPDYVIIYHGLNDFAADSPSVAPDFSGAERVGSHWSHHFYVTSLLRRAHVWDLLANALPSLPTISDEFVNIIEPRQRAQVPTMAERRIMSIYRRNIESIVAIARANGITPVLALTASMFGAKPEEKAKVPGSYWVGNHTELDMVEGIRAMNQILVDIGQKYGVPVAATNVIDGVGDAFLDPSHQSAKGHLDQAEALYKVIYPTLLAKSH